MNPAKSHKPTEIEVGEMWQRQLRKRRLLNDCEGRPVAIIYPGRRNDGRGGDFRDALVSSGRASKSGDIEIHTRSSGWQAHRHHRDPAYNRVVLHVALEQDNRVRAVLQSGQVIPTIILDQTQEQDADNLTKPYPCQRSSKAKSKIAHLERAGEQRFFSRASRYRAELAEFEDGQSLYQGIVEALGYTKNKQPFLDLARRLPLLYLESIVKKKRAEEDILIQVQSRLLASASDLEWELYRVRPDNSPPRRIAALSYLLYRHRERGWLATVMSIFERTPTERVRKELELAFIIGVGHPVLLGQARAAEIIVNVVLPFAWSWGEKRGESALCDKVIEVYRQYPRLESNSIERHMLQQLSLGRHLVNSACRQQGLIQIYKTFCIQGKCVECGISSKNHL